MGKNLSTKRCFCSKSDDTGWLCLKTSPRDNRAYNKSAAALSDNCFFLSKKFSFTLTNEVTGIPRENLTTMTRLRCIMEGSISRSSFILSSLMLCVKCFQCLLVIDKRVRRCIDYLGHTTDRLALSAAETSSQQQELSCTDSNGLSSTRAWSKVRV